jgi:hypothetical protein
MRLRHLVWWEYPDFSDRDEFIVDLTDQERTDIMMRLADLEDNEIISDWSINRVDTTTIQPDRLIALVDEIGGYGE